MLKFQQILGNKNLFFYLFSQIENNGLVSDKKYIENYLNTLLNTIHRSERRFRFQSFSKLFLRFNFLFEIRIVVSLMNYCIQLLVFFINFTYVDAEFLLINDGRNNVNVFI